MGDASAAYFNYIGDATYASQTTTSNYPTAAGKNAAMWKSQGCSSSVAYYLCEVPVAAYTCPPAPPMPPPVVAAASDCKQQSPTILDSLIVHSLQQLMCGTSFSCQKPALSAALSEAGRKALSLVAMGKAIGTYALQFRSPLPTEGPAVQPCRSCAEYTIPCLTSPCRRAAGQQDLLLQHDK
jgi:hypothetical protein